MYNTTNKSAKFSDRQSISMELPIKHEIFVHRKLTSILLYISYVEKNLAIEFFN